jgi:hypothetical protein
VPCFSFEKEDMPFPSRVKSELPSVTFRLI